MSSSSESATSSQVNQADNRNVLGERAINAQGGSNVSIQTLDGEVINRALQNNALTVDSVLNFGSRTVDGAFSFGDNALSESFDFGKSAMKMADLANERAADNIAGSYQNAMKLSQSVLEKSFSNLTDSQNMVATAYQDAKGRGAMTDKMMLAAIVAVSVVAFSAVNRT